MPRTCKHFKDLMFGPRTEEWRGFSWCGRTGRACWSEGKARSQRLPRTRRKEKVSSGGQVKSGKGVCEAEQDGKVARVSATLSVCDVCEYVSLSVHVCEYVSVFEERSQTPLQWAKMDRTQ